MERSDKKSNLKQLQILVEYMEANPEFARGSVIFGKNKKSLEKQWIGLTKKLNSYGPLVRSIVEWKKTWTDLTSRTKTKIAENKKSLCETGGDLYRVNALSELEQIIDRTLFLSKAAAPEGKVFGLTERTSPKSNYLIESCFTLLSDTPPRTSKSVAVVTPSRQQESVEKMPQPTHQTAELSPFSQKPQKRQLESNDDDLPSCSSAKKEKSIAEEQIGLIRRQLRVGEQSAAVAKHYSDAAVMLAEAAKAIADAAKRIADAAEIQAASAKANIVANEKIVSSLEGILKVLMENS